MAQVPATSIESTSLGDVAEFTIPFPFLSRAEVFVTVDGVSVPFTWINDGLVQLAAVPELGAVVRRYRSTLAYVPLHQFSTGVPFLPRYVDRDFKQTLYAVQESVNETAGTAAQALATAEESLVLVQDAFDILAERTQYIVKGPYGPGILFETTSEVFSYLGEFYAPGPALTLPYTTTGAGAGEIANFRSVGDAVLRSDLAASSGAGLVGYGAGTVKDALEVLETVVGKLEAYIPLVSAPIVAINAALAESFGISLTSNIGSLNLSGGAAGKTISVDVAFYQDVTGGRTVAKPANVRLPVGVTEIANADASSTTLVRFTNINNSAEWLYQRLAVFTIPVAKLPELTAENFIFSDEGGSTAGWTGTNATFATSSGWLRTTKAGAGDSVSSLPLSSPISTKQDFIMYVSARVSFGTNGVGVLKVSGPSGWWPFSLWLNSANASTFSEGAVSIQGYDGTTVRQAQVVGAAASSTVPLNIAIQYDSTFNAVTVWVRQSDGRYKFGCRIVHNFSAVNAIGTGFTDFSNAGSWVEFDYFSLARPNIAVLSDSISAGATLFDPNPSNGLSNDESTWMRHAVLYPALRNNLVVNKGIGGNTSAQLLARVTDLTNNGVKVGIVQASNNDKAAGVSQATRTANIQSTVNALTASGASAVLLNGLYCTAAAPDNTPTPTFRDYMKTWWDTERPAITGVSLAINAMTPVAVAGDFLDPAKTQPDGVHPNLLGHTAIGDYIETFN